MKSKYNLAQRIGAMVCIILLVLMYVATLVFSLMKTPWAQTMFKTALGLTIGLPILAWGYIWMIGRLTNRHTIADIDFCKPAGTDETGEK